MKTNFILSGLVCALSVATVAPAADEGATPVTRSPAAAGSGVEVGISKHDGVTVSAGEAFVTRNGVTEKLVKDLKLPSGVIVRPDGNVVFSSGTHASLQADQLLTLDGRILDVRPDPNENPPLPSSGTQRAVTSSSTVTNSGGIGVQSGKTLGSLPMNGGGNSGSVFIGADGVPFIGTVTSLGVITTNTGTTIPIDKSIRAMSFGPTGVPFVGRLNANGTISTTDGATIFPDGSVRSSTGTLISPATANRGASVAPNMVNGQSGVAAQGTVTTRQGSTNQQGTSTQQGATTQQGTTTQQGISNQQPGSINPNQPGFSTTPQGSANQTGTSSQTGSAGVTRQPGNAAPRNRGNTPATNGNAGGAVTNGGGAPAGGAAR